MCAALIVALVLGHLHETLALAAVLTGVGVRGARSHPRGVPSVAPPETAHGAAVPSQRGLR